MKKLRNEIIKYYYKSKVLKGTERENSQRKRTQETLIMVMFRETGQEDLFQ